MNEIISAQRSLIVAADVPTLKRVRKLAKAAQGIQDVGAFKLGFSLGFCGLKEAVATVKDELGQSFTIIYDHQKAGNDIPETGALFARDLRHAKVDASILFPFTGLKTQIEWTKACFGEGIKVITGGMMTHSNFLVSEGGYINDDAPEKIYRLACELGVRDFVVPGNKIHWVRKIYAWLVEELGKGNFTLYAPGFLTQGGDVSECGLAAGNNWHAIVGSGIYRKQRTRERRAVMNRLCRQFVA